MYIPGVCLYHYDSASTTEDGRHTLNEYTEANLEKLLAKWDTGGSDEALFYGKDRVIAWAIARERMREIQSTVNKGDVVSAFKKIDELARDAAEFPEGMLLSAGMCSRLGKHDRAIEMLQKLLFGLIL